MTTSTEDAHTSKHAPFTSEHHLVFNTLKTVVELLNSVLSDNIEVVLHDMTQPECSVIAIAHGHVTGRGIGDSILAGPKGDVGFAAAKQDASSKGAHNSIIANYTTINKDGALLHSCTAIFRDNEGSPFAALCFNSDRTIPEIAYNWLSRMLGKELKADILPEHKPAKMDNLMTDIIYGTLASLGKPVKMLSKEEKIYAVATMQSSGLFVARGGVNQAAKALGVTRYTIYNYLDELKKRGK